MTSPDLDALDKVAKAAMPGAVTGDWYVVEPAYLPRDTEAYVIAGSPDPHVGEMVCDFPDASMAGVEDKYDDDEWTARNWALAEYIAAFCPTTAVALIERIKTLEANQRTPGTVEVCRLCRLDAALGRVSCNDVRVVAGNTACPIRSPDASGDDKGGR